MVRKVGGEVSTDFVIHPCAISVKAIETPRGPGIDIIFRHELGIDGICRVCQEYVEYKHKVGWSLRDALDKTTSPIS